MFYLQSGLTKSTLTRPSLQTIGTLLCLLRAFSVNRSNYHLARLNGSLNWTQVCVCVWVVGIIVVSRRSYLHHQGSTYCFLYPSIFSQLSQSAKMLYKADENLYYLPEDYQTNPSPLRITITTSRQPFVLELPLGSTNGAKWKINGKKYIASYFQPQTLETEGNEELEGLGGFPGNVLGSVRLRIRIRKEFRVGC